MQRVTNTVLRKNDEVLMLQKPRRGWYVVPGGKMEPGEHIKETAAREYKEETGLTLKDPQLRSVFTFIMKDGEEVAHEWMMFTFYSEDYSGTLKAESPEGELEWVPVAEVLQKPMAEGDQHYLRHILNHNSILYGTFTYTLDFKLLDVTLDPMNP
ncbi:8-oxo-dGTP diphosphatase [Pontibacillus sp. ALD_SL1]|uniref:8-oxo-dGTP diphosphatase n=1 Tax=Pontibacillus sp. ALD_SL1 TaxID=2777185 RepID=UPI001A973CB4|nr:8-oxo-dGTP diphosphatase [Pontibacillus sp. ALD_SL1]QSS99556.1 8-oxo-dGTP diphosphatase [Pontibacillus sp. ALD_SL1]